MQLRMRVSIVDIRQHAAKKRAVASEAGSFRLSKKGRATISMPMREPEVPSASVPKSVLVLSAPTAFPEVLFIKDGVAREDRVAAALSVAPSTKARIEVEVVAELDQSVAAPDVPPIGLSQVQSSSNFFAFSSAKISMGDRGRHW